MIYEVELQSIENTDNDVLMFVTNLMKIERHVLNDTLIVLIQHQAVKVNVQHILLETTLP